MSDSAHCPDCQRDLPLDSFFWFDRTGGAHRMHRCRACRAKHDTASHGQAARVRISLIAFDGEDAATAEARHIAQRERKTPEQKLATAVLAQAIHDLMSWRLRRLKRTLWLDAYDFFFHPKDRWRLDVWCEAAGEEEWLWHERAEKALARCQAGTPSPFANPPKV